MERQEQEHHNEWLRLSATEKKSAVDKFINAFLNLACYARITPNYVNTPILKKEIVRL